MSLDNETMVRIAAACRRKARAAYFRMHVAGTTFAEALEWAAAADLQGNATIDKLGKRYFNQMVDEVIDDALEEHDIPRISRLHRYRGK